MDTEIIAAIVGAAAAILAAIIAAISQKMKKSDSGPPVSGNQNVVGDHNNVEFILSAKEEALLQIVDAELAVDDDDFFLDIKLRNSGGKIAYIKQIEFTVYDVYAMSNPQITEYEFISPTATYDVVLNGDKRQVFSLSQAVAANGADRFRIKVASSIAEVRMAAVYYFSFTLYYNEDNKTAESQKYISVFPSTSEWAGYYVSQTSMEIAKSNYAELLRMSQHEGIKSDAFLSILKSYEESKSDFMHCT